MAMNRPAVRLHIERLVLDGVPAVDSAAFARALEARIGQLLSEHGVPQGATSARRLESGPVSWSDATPHDLGARVAGAVYRSLGGQKP